MRKDYLSDASYDSFPDHDFIHHNHFSDNGTAPKDEAALLADVAGVTKVEDIVWDGELAPGASPSICLDGNGQATYRDIDYADLFQHTSTNIAPVTCVGTSLAPLPTFPVALAAAPIPQQPHDALSAYGFFTGPLAAQAPAAGVLPYDVNLPLFSDDAQKLRFLVLPPGGKIGFDATGHWSFPDGTTIIKTFYYPKDPLDASAGRVLLETRLEMLLSGTWTLQTYLWNDDQSDAVRFTAGKTLDVAVTGAPYRVPSSEECHTCHLASGVTVPLGVRTRQVNRVAAGTLVNQIDAWAQAGLFSTTPPPASTLEALVPAYGSASLDARARSYLDANCGHCHSEGGTADATGLRLSLETTDMTDLGVCRSPVSAGPGSGMLLFDVVPGQPDQSIIAYRMGSTAPQVKMPQLPTMTSDAAGTELVREWISALPGKGCAGQ